MEKILKRYRDLSFRRAFLLAVLVTFAAVVLLSGAAILACGAFRNSLAPDPNGVMLKLEYLDGTGSPGILEQEVTLGREPVRFSYLTEIREDGEPVSSLTDPASFRVSAVKLERAVDVMGPRRRLAYGVCGVLMVFLPGLFSVTGILVCGFLFYRLKMKEPLAVLNQAVDEIISENLDFSLEYQSGDEMGRLCASFEKMRQVLLENHRALWKMAEERRLLQASVAHDLRNPIAILAGYAEYLQIGLEKRSLTRERMMSVTKRLNEAAGRLSRYTESVRYLNRIEDMELQPVSVCVREFAENMAEDFTLLAAERGICLETVWLWGEGSGETALPQTVKLDRDVVYRITENLMRNALEAARGKVRISFGVEEETPVWGRGFFTVEIRDDGPGFPEKLLQEQRNRETTGVFPDLYGPGEKRRGGLGLVVARLLCRRHGGRLELSNGAEPEAGGVAKVWIGI